MQCDDAQVQIGAASATDLLDLLALEALFPSDQMSRRSLRRLLARPGCVWVARKGGALIGSLVLLMPARWKVARIYSVVVAPAARGQGVARALVQAAERHAQHAGRTGMQLEVRDDNRAARRLYQTLGYRPLQKLPDYYDDGAAGERWAKSFQSVA